MKALLFSLALLVTYPRGARPQASGEGAALGLTAVRFYRPAGSQTVIDAFCRIPFALVDPLSPGRGGAGAYRLGIVVRDSAGLELLTQTWTDSVPARLMTMAGGSTVEHFNFAARPGRYTVDVTLTDSATGRVTRQRAVIEAYAAPPAGSDLLLATNLRAASGDAALEVGEIRKGGLVLQASGRPVLTPQQARLGYYLELYPQRAETVSVAARVKRADGSQVVATPAQRIPVAAGGGATHALMDLAGLPPGDYRLEVVAAGGGADSVVRESGFRVAGFETERALEEAGPVRDVFAEMSEPRLDTLYLPLVYLMTAEDQGVYPTLTLEGKRRWLRLFWRKRDPTPGTPRNEAQEDFYARIAEANRRYYEGGAAQIPGWRTDRGRIFIKYGPPDQVANRPQAGNTRPYEVWKYTHTRALKYVFLDQTLFGNYSLIWTDDRREPSRPNWQELLGPEAVIDVERF